MQGITLIYIFPRLCVFLIWRTKYCEYGIALKSQWTENCFLFVVICLIWSSTRYSMSLYNCCWNQYPVYWNLCVWITAETVGSLALQETKKVQWAPKAYTTDSESSFVAEMWIQLSGGQSSLAQLPSNSQAKLNVLTSAKPRLYRADWRGTGIWWGGVYLQDDDGDDGHLGA